MKPEETPYESIDLYLNGKLEGEAFSAFTDKLESDKEFSILVLNQKAANDIIVGNRLAMVKQMMDADFKSKDSGNGTGKWWLGGLLGSSILVCSLLYHSNKTKPEIASAQTTAAEKQKNISQNNLFDLDQQTAQDVPAPASMHSLNADATSIQTTSVELHTQPDIQGNTPSDFKNQHINNINPLSIDSSHIKNVLPDKQFIIQKTDVCKGLSIDAILNIDAACTNKNDGEIHIREQSLKGGRSPYTYILIDASNDTIKQKTSSFVSLTAGSYKLFFKDADACISAYKKPVYVSEKSCATQRTQSFSPHSGEQFNYPVSGESDAEITIYNRGGQVVHKTHLAKGASEFWDGTNQNGQLLPTGMYIYIIEYLSGTKETGEVVIF